MLIDLTDPPEDLKKRNLLLLIDPSFSKMGAVIVDPKNFSQQKHKTGDWRKVWKWIRDTASLDRLMCIIENPDLDSATFDMIGVVKGPFFAWAKNPTNKVLEEKAMSAFGIAQNYAQKVGKSKASGKEIIKALEAAKIPFVEVAPSKRKKAVEKVWTYNEDGTKKAKEEKPIRNKLKLISLPKPTKTDKDQYYELTGYGGPSSIDSRDAGTLGIGVTMTWMLNEILTKRAREAKEPPSTPRSGNHNYYLKKRKRK